MNRNKPLLGGALVVAATLLLLLVTCEGPGTATMEEPALVSTAPAPESPTPESPAQPAVPATREAAPTPDTPEPTPAPSAQPATSPAPAPAPAPTPAPADAPAFTWPTPAPQPPLPRMAARPPTPVPTTGLAVYLAVSPRALEGGTTPAVLLLPADSLREQLRIPLAVDRDWLPADYTRGQPASTINTPTAYGQRWGDLFAGVGYQDRIRYDDWSDGVASLGFGLGNPTRYVGLDVAFNILDTYTEFAEDRSLSLKLHRRLPFRTALAVGHENLWHTDGTDGGSSRYVVVSKLMLFRDRPTTALGSMVVNVGLGNDRFLSEEAFARGEDGVNVFGSVGVRLLRPVNAIANWTGQDLALGASVAPVRTWPLVITPAVVDVTGRAGDGPRFAVSAGLNYNFRR
jgi:hypothetical protein